MATILFDDNSDALVLGQDAVHETLVSQNFIGGSAIIIFSGSLHLLFSGIEISIFGSMDRRNPSTPVPTPNIGEIFIDGVSIENNVTLLDETAIGLIYQLPQLSDTKHVLTLSNVSSIIVDFFTVTAGNPTSHSGSTLLLSSSDTAISYEGNWIQNDTTLVDDDHQSRRPIGGATRDASFGDASATISFIGTSIAVLGTHYSDPRVPCSPTFYLDGKEQSYHSPQRSGPNYPWFSSQQLTNGNHVLKIDLSGNTSGAHFSLEYITFAASSENLDTNTHQVPPSVFIGIGAGVGVLVIGILLILWWWYRRRSRRSQSDSAATSVETSVLPDPAYQGAKRGRMNQRVEKSTLQACSARILTPYFPAVSESTRQNEVSTSVKTQYNRSTQVQRLSDSEERRIKQPRRKEDAWQYSKTPTNVLNLPTKPSSSRLPYVSVQSPRATAPYHLARNPQHLNKPKTDRPQHVASATSEGTGTSPIGHLPEGAWGMRMQQLEELIWELRGETAPLELGQDQVGTGHSTTLTAMMEEISEHRKSVEKNQFRGEERYSVPHGNAV